MLRYLAWTCSSIPWLCWIAHQCVGMGCASMRKLYQNRTCPWYGCCHWLRLCMYNGCCECVRDVFLHTRQRKAIWQSNGNRTIRICYCCCWLPFLSVFRFSFFSSSASSLENIMCAGAHTTMKDWKRECALCLVVIFFATLLHSFQLLSEFWTVFYFVSKDAWSGKFHKPIIIGAKAQRFHLVE